LAGTKKKKKKKFHGDFKINSGEGRAENLGLTICCILAAVGDTPAL